MKGRGMSKASETIGAVVIGRNEGDRLKRCLKSLSNIAVVYVDSGSTDGSAQWACQHGAELVELDMSAPFTAARARNAGYRKLQEIVPDLNYVQFVDGDCELVDNWIQTAIAFLAQRPDVGAVCGRRRERFPDRSIYNWLCDLEWSGPVGEVRACGGDVMIRRGAFEAAGGYRDDMIAGEEPELCVRLRAAGWRIWRLDVDMTLHDAAITRFAQWWRRAARGGYAFAQGAYLHGAPPERHFVWESNRAWIWGVGVPLGCLAVGLIFPPWGWAIWLIYPLQILRQTIRNAGPLRQRATLALFQTLIRFPEAFGQITYIRNRLFRRRAQLIEYK